QSFEAVEPLGIAAETPTGGVADPAEADRIELVQRRHLAARVPPLIGQCRKAGELGLVDGRRGGRGAGTSHVISRTSLVSRFRSSQEFAATSKRTSESKGH